jgi:translation initiation factor IF-3
MNSAAVLLSSARALCLHGSPRMGILSVWLSSRSASSTTRTHIRNDEIQYAFVRLVDSETGRLNPPKPLRDILSSVNLKTHFVELVGEQPDPIVKIISKKDAFDRFKERKAKMKSTAKNEIEQKEIQLTWGVAAGDLVHKLKKVREELEKGNRVDVVYARKRGQRLPSPQEMEARVQETLGLMQDIGKEWKQRDVQRAATVIHLQGGPKPS